MRPVFQTQHQKQEHWGILDKIPVAPNRAVKGFLLDTSICRMLDHLVTGLPLKSKTLKERTIKKTDSNT